MPHPAIYRVAHPTGYPIYRLEWQAVGWLQRRLRNCMGAMRAEPYDYGAPELVDLEFFLMWRARGMAMETPAVASRSSSPLARNETMNDVTAKTAAPQSFAKKASPLA